jgi:four helix bundle protein
MQNFKELKVWQRSHQITLKIYKITKNFPREELYGLISQMRRSSASVPTNIAEGCGRGSNAELARFLQIAMGSASELEYQLLLSLDLSFIDLTTYNNLNIELTETKRMLNSLLQKLKTKN